MSDCLDCDNAKMFNVGARDRVRDRVLEMARRDERVVAAAIVGSCAYGGGDRWSDIDLSFAVRDDVSVSEVLDDWSRTVTKELGALHVVPGPSAELRKGIGSVPSGGARRLHELIGDIGGTTRADPWVEDSCFGTAG